MHPHSCIMCLLVICPGLISATVEAVISQSKTLPCPLPQLLVSDTHAERQDTHTHRRTHTDIHTQMHRMNAHSTEYTHYEQQAVWIPYYGYLVWLAFNCLCWFIVINVLNDHCVLHRHDLLHSIYYPDANTHTHTHTADTRHWFC